MPPYIVNANNAWTFQDSMSLSQNLNMASKIDIVPILTQAYNAPVRVAGFGKGYIVDVAPDFDATLEFGE